MAKSKQRTLLFEAEGQTVSGETRHFSAYEQGDAFYIVGQNIPGTGLYQHLCHPSVKNHEGIKREIESVFNVKVTNVKLPWEPHSSEPHDVHGSQS